MNPKTRIQLTCWTILQLHHAQTGAAYQPHNHEDSE